MNVIDKTGRDPAGQDGSRWMANPFAWAAAATHYTIDAWQRGVLYADIRRQRGNQFCSYGDNITPPGQALGWITDLYRDDADVAGHDQTIVFATHESIGHLGIFVSSSVGRKEHRKFASNIDMLGAGRRATTAAPPTTPPCSTASAATCRRVAIWPPAKGGWQRASSR